jgi:hypothetical protein
MGSAYGSPEALFLGPSESHRGAERGSSLIARPLVCLY